jgi:cation diffusion facilitator CzcD-associated flavoprotein CzcO
MRPPQRSGGTHYRVAIIGAGFGGLGLAHHLRTQGIDDLVLVERASTVGGTWRDNTYPGAQCDVPAHLYSFSCAPNPDWSRTYADGPEIQAYLEGFADQFGLRPLIRFNTAVSAVCWNDQQRHWDITTSNGSLTATSVVVATGLLSEPDMAAVPGIDTFDGEVFHSGGWRHDVELAGRRVAVVGTGASAIQFVPAIAPLTDHLTVFQRTPPWIVPRTNPPISKTRRRWYRRFGLTQQLQRARTFWTREILAVAMTKRTNWLTRGEQLARRHLEAQVPDPALRRRLTPDYALGCKRVLLSDDWYPALQRDNVSLVDRSVDHVGADGVVDAAGEFHPAEVLILGTGFNVTHHPMFGSIVGRHGTSLGTEWSTHGMAAHLGTTVAGFPNLFLVTGPNTGVGHTSMVFMMESQYPYITGALHTIGDRGALALEVREDAQRAFNDALATQMGSTVWTTGGCASWYLDDHGRNTTLWPDTAWAYRKRLRRFDVANYEIR